jgi:hypothetical protein
MGNKSRRNKLVPGCEAALEQMKYEIAAELGLPVAYSASASADAEFAAELGAAPGGSGAHFDWGSITSREAGAVGGSITQRLVRQAQQSMPAKELL